MADKFDKANPSKNDAALSDRSPNPAEVLAMVLASKNSPPDPEIAKEVLKLESKKQDHDQQRFYTIAAGAAFLIVFFVIAVIWVQTNDKLVSLFGAWLDRIIFLVLGGGGGFVYGKFKKDD